jgi:hypothetical protein
MRSGASPSFNARRIRRIWTSTVRDDVRMLALHVEVELARARIGEAGAGVRGRRDSAEGDALHLVLILLQTGVT